ncbi:chemotaxis protein CheB [Natrialba asiatica]|uniref:Protein-glutamate methylesterase/protein-glutamine glutaminase n=1 Tax=Natrialba asiatica (strain ATCC 700177 / DSM 12278 / JCM 9576 / FERM P-10747 / NBRC 102637 / 172P1) TaxID=29540 RepID=M0AT13_NATA1|nr:chemotaxis protein CheB [Natrialba asiatica]ELZ00494.1 chemotaxis-specific methylesterase [Natrialba asiatica DSM 12278]
MTRVLVVDDSRFMRTVIGNALTEAGYEVETATNGVEAVETVTSFDPAVVTMDVEMPELGGIEAVERIMADNPTLILMLSAYTSEGTDATLDALERGAIDFLHKPDGSGSRNIGHLADDVVAKVDELAAADVSSLALARAAASAHATSTHVADAPSRSATPAGTTASTSVSSATSSVNSSPAGPETPSPPATATPVTDRARADTDEFSATDAPVIVIGASTGGPKIVERLFARLPLALEATVVVVQHMPPEFTDRFAARLDAHSEYAVREATDGARIGPGEAVVAAGGYHLQVVDSERELGPDPAHDLDLDPGPETSGAGQTHSQSLRVALDDGERRHGLRPAIDVSMETAAEQVTGPLCGVVLTGMGSDGAAGIEAIQGAGGYTIAQNEATSPVFGIPCQAIETGCVDTVVPDTEVVPTILETFTAADAGNGGEGETDD